jgi:hypothetical protein
MSVRQVDVSLPHTSKQKTDSLVSVLERLFNTYTVTFHVPGLFPSSVTSECYLNTMYSKSYRRVYLVWRGEVFPQGGNLQCYLPAVVQFLGRTVKCLAHEICLRTSQPETQE